MLSDWLVCVVSMCSAGTLREFISGRLTAAALEIFTMFEQTIAHYEEEIDRLRRHGVPLQSVCELKTSFNVKQEEPEPPGEADPRLLKQEAADEENLQPPPASESSACASTSSICSDVHRDLDHSSRTSTSFCRRTKTDDLQKAVSPEEKFWDQQEREAAQVQVNQEDFPTFQEPEQLLPKSDILPVLLTANKKQLEPVLQDQDFPAGGLRQAELEFLPHRQSLSKRRKSSTLLENLEKNRTPEENLRTSTFHFEYHNVPTEKKPRSPQDPGSTGSTQMEIQHRPNRDTETTTFMHPAPPDGQSGDVCGTLVNLPLSMKRNPLCDICGKIFSKKSLLKNHLRSHTGERPYSCPKCGKRFGHKQSLDIHMRTHTGEKPHFCLMCGKRFGLKQTLEIHVRTHTGEKPHSCITCGKSFSQRSHLSNHMRTHTGEKPYSCQICGKNFTRNTSLSRHMRSYTGEKPHSQ